MADLEGELADGTTISVSTGEENKPMTKDELIQAIGDAYNKGEYKLMGKLSGQMAKLEADEARAAKDAQQAAVKELTEDVKKIIRKALKPMYEGGQLDAADGVWFSWDFGQGDLVDCRLIKGAARKAGGGTGGGKKFSTTTNELLSKHGSEMMGDSGKTFQQAYDENTDGNSRYKVRVKLLKVEGLS